MEIKQEPEEIISDEEMNYNALEWPELSDWEWEEEEEDPVRRAELVSSVDVMPWHRLGKGSFGKVWAVTDPRTGEALAVKKIGNVFQDMNQSRRVLREIRILSIMNHENVMSLVSLARPDCLASFNEIFVVMEIMDCDLSSIIYRDPTLEPYRARVYMYQILRGLKYLHSAGVLHRDLRPDNVLVKNRWLVKLTDFGWGRGQGEPGHALSGGAGSNAYMAPELLLRRPAYSKEVDMWSLGCLMAELLGRQALFLNKSSAGVLYLIRRFLNKRPFGRPPSRISVKVVDNNFTKFFTSTMATKWAINFLRTLLVWEPWRRPTAEEALAHPYMHQGRLSYHLHHCTCCQDRFGVRYVASDLEPTSNFVFDEYPEERFSTTWEVQGELRKVVLEKLCSSFYNLHLVGYEEEEIDWMAPNQF